MRKPLFTPEELEELRRADEELEANFFITSQERRQSNERDVHSRNERRDNKKEAIAARAKAYYEENKEAIAAYQKAYREENKEAIAAYQKAYREENKEAIAARRKARRCAKKQTALEAAI